MIFGDRLLQIIFFINFLKYSFYLYVDLRQKKCYEIKEIPKYIVDAYKDCGEVNNAEFEKSQAYSNSKMVFNIFKKAVGFILNWAFVIYFVYPLIWKYIYKNITSNEYIASLLFSGAIILLDYPVSLIFDLYYTFILEEKYGFNNSTLIIFIKDQIKSALLMVIFGSILLPIMIYIANNTGKYFYVYIALVQFLFTFILIAIYPVFIVPLFNKLTPIENQELVTKINDLCRDVKFPLKNIYQMDASIRSSHGNAFFSGAFKSKSIVLFDTILDFPQEEIIAIIGHEIGHWKNWDNYKILFFSFIQTLLTLYLFHLTFNWDDLYTCFGFSLDSELGGRKFLLSLLVFSYIQGPISSLIGIFQSIISQYNEYKADEFSFSLGFGDSLCRSLFRLHKKSSSCMIFDPIYSFIHLSHPSVCDRIIKLKSLKNKAF